MKKKVDRQTLLDRAEANPEGAICPECHRIMTGDDLKLYPWQRIGNRDPRYTSLPYDAEALPICSECEDKAIIAENPAEFFLDDSL